MLSYSVYFEIKHEKWSTRVSVLSTCVCKLWLKSAIGYRNFGKAAYGSFLRQLVHVTSHLYMQVGLNNGD